MLKINRMFRWKETQVDSNGFPLEGCCDGLRSTTVSDGPVFSRLNDPIDMSPETSAHPCFLIV